MPPSQSKINNGDGHTLEQFLRDLESTTIQVQKLLGEIRETEVDFAGIKAELRILCDDVKTLSSAINDGEGSLFTKFAVLNHKVEDLRRDLISLEENIDSAEHDKRVQQVSLATIEITEKTGKWQMRVALATGVLALLGTVATTLIGLFK